MLENLLVNLAAVEVCHGLVCVFGEEVARFMVVMMGLEVCWAYEALMPHLTRELDGVCDGAGTFISVVMVVNTCLLHQQMEVK